MIISLTLLGQLLELRARSKTSAAIKALLGLTPKTARRIKADGREEDIPLEEPPAEPAEDTRTNDQLIGELRAYGDALSIRQQVDAAVSKHLDEREWLQRQLTRLQERFEESQRAAG